jgi:photosystem II stability/assembly factor-like uncharacterized protein
MNMRLLLASYLSLLLSCSPGQGEWQLVSSRPEAHYVPITALSFVDSSTGWAATPGGLLSTKDGGLTWLEAKSGQGIFSAIQVHFESSQSGSAIGVRIVEGKSHPAILKTADGGAAWSETSIPSTQVLVAAEFCSAGNVLLVTERTILRSEDSGATWALALELAGGQRFSGVSCRAGGEAFATVLKGVAYVSADKGETWREVQVPCMTPWMRARYVRDELWVIGPEGCTVMSQDRGASWKVLPTPSEAAYFDVGGAGDTRWLIGAGGLILESRDGGLTWNRQDSLTGADLTTLFVADDGHAWIGGDQATVLTWK